MIRRIEIRSGQCSVRSLLDVLYTMPKPFAKLFEQIGITRPNYAGPTAMSGKLNASTYSLKSVI